MAAPRPEAVPPGPPSEAESNREAFLLAMYKAMWDNINRHILVVWQSMTALLAALGAAYLSGKDLIDKDLAPSFVVLAAGWAIAHSIDSKAWFNRNLLIIRNIERQFLDSTHDQTEIHYLFARPPHTSMVDHLRIQVVLASAVGLVVLVHHFLARVAPSLNPQASIDWKATVPYLLTLVVVVLLFSFNRGVDATQRKLSSSSPGKSLGH